MMGTLACKHAVVMCPLHDCNKCQYRDNMEACPFAAHDSADSSCPTFAQMLEIYKSSGHAGVARSRGVAGFIQQDLAELGIPLDAKASIMTRQKFKELIRLLTSTTRPLSKNHPVDGPLSDYTVSGHLSAFKAISSEALEDRYEREGLDLPSFSIPRFEIRKRPVQEVSDKTIRKVEILMERWLASGTESDRSAYILAFFALYCGMRLGDICDLKWDVFRNTTEGLMVVYTPHKSVTRRKPNGRLVSFRIDNKAYCRIEPLVGRPDEYVIPRHDNRTGAKTTKNGLFKGKHVYLAKKVRRALKEVGIGTEYRGQKTIHALRKYFETDRAFRNGNEEAANACGHTVKVQQSNYMGTMVGKVS